MSRTRTRSFGIASIVLAAVAVAVVALRGGDGNAAGTTQPKESSTATVARRDLVVREEVNGTLGYGDERPLVTTASGTITWLPEAGTLVRRGGKLYELNAQAVTLFYGAEPAWRRLEIGVEDGDDVRQLEANLVALGYDPQREITIDGTYDWATRAAVARWEQARGVRADGVVELGDVVFLPGARRIGEVETAVGAQVQAGAEVMATSAQKAGVSVDLDANKQSLVAEGDAVTVELPTGEVVDGKIVRVGKVAESAGGGDAAAGGGEESDEDPTIEVEIALSKDLKTALDEAPVDVNLEKERTENALTVPVGALLALAGGGYAVEVVDGGGTRLVAVDVGAFADGYVQIAGDGIREGVRVVVPE